MCHNLLASGSAVQTVEWSFVLHISIPPPYISVMQLTPVNLTAVALNVNHFIYSGCVNYLTSEEARGNFLELISGTFGGSFFVDSSRISEH